MITLPLLFAQAADSAAAPIGFLERMDSDQLFIVLLVAIGCGTGIIIASVAIIVGVLNSTRQRQIEAELKQDMLDRGMTSEEIEQVIKAQPKEGLDHWVEVWSKKKER